MQGESRFARNNLYLGELEVEVPKGPKGQEAVDVTYTYDINSLLEVEVKVISTGASRKMIIKGAQNTMTEEEIVKRMEELSYLKIQLRDQEENKLALLKKECMRSLLGIGVWNWILLFAALRRHCAAVTEARLIQSESRSTVLWMKIEGNIQSKEIV